MHVSSLARIKRDNRRRNGHQHSSVELDTWIPGQLLLHPINNAPVVLSDCIWETSKLKRDSSVCSKRAPTLSCQLPSFLPVTLESSQVLWLTNFFHMFFSEFPQWLGLLLFFHSKALPTERLMFWHVSRLYKWHKQVLFNLSKLHSDPLCNIRVCT